MFSHDDTPTGCSSVSRIIKRYAKLAGVPPIQAKGLRHSHVSYLINEFNADVLTVSRRLGHSGPEITLKYYAHLWSRNDEPLAEKMSGNLKIKFAKNSLVKFNGNQAVRFD
ncbi:tyrosine-type recombinase/integrase [Ligilactobacillus ruminis]|nr:tyrosine-type recombinase/integrase [Ligilactobacillus ruminis]